MLKFLILILATLTLSACGFHLRGPVELPAALSPIYIDTDQPYAPFEQKLRANLESSHIEVVGSPSSEVAILKILNRNLTTTLISISPSTLTTQYNITYAVTYEVLDRDHNLIIPSSVVSSSNTYSANNNQMLGAANQQGALVENLRNNTVFLLMSRLGSKQVRDAFITGKPSNAR
jgi:LPS-assembly lipoprotein